MSALQACLDEAHNFLTARDTFTEADCLQAADSALSALQSIHDAAVVIENFQEPDLSPTAPLNGTQNRLTLNGLFEVIAVAGIQPCLSASIGIPFEKRVQLRVFQQAIPLRSDVDQHFLFSLVKDLSEIINGENEGVKRFVRDRLLMDIVCGAAQLAYGSDPQHNDSARLQGEAIFKLTLDKTPIHYVLPLLTSLVQSSPPLWFKWPLLEYLALVPLRRNGVRNIVDFVASAAPSAYDGNNERELSGRQQGPSLSSESLARAAHLLSSLPRSMSPEEYFETLSNQLYSLLDGDSGPDMVRAASYIIGTGILGKRDLGAPGKPGWKAFADPLILSLNPKLSRTSPQMSKENEAQPTQPLVSQPTLSTNLNRLSTIVQNTPSPGLTKRLIGPILLPLWALYNHSISRSPESPQTTLTLQLLRLYVIRCATSQQLSNLSSNIFWNGPQEWIFGADNFAGIDIRQRLPEDNATANTLENMLSLDQRSKAFADIVDSSPDDAIVGEVFIDVSRRWLTPMMGKPKQRQIIEEDEISPLQALVDAAVAKAMIERLQPRLMKSHVHIINLVKDILKDYLKNKSLEHEKRQRVQQASYRGLEHIVSFPDTRHKSAGTASPNREVNSSDDDELALAALSLINAFTTAEDPEDTAAMVLSLGSLLQVLSALNDSHLDIPASIRTNAQNLSTIIHTLSEDSPLGSRPSTGLQAPSTPAEDRASYIQALNDLASTSPPVRVEAISLIRHLITSRSTIIDPQTTTHLLLNSALRDEEDYVYLAGIQALIGLCTAHQTSVFRILVNNYADREQERSLDERLRVGEAIAQILTSIAQKRLERATALSNSQLRLEPAAGTYLAEALIGISGRRGSRSKEAARKRQDDKRAEREARRAWGGDVPEVPVSFLGNADDGDRDQNDRLVNILRGWEGTGEEEDVRMRTSALSLLGKLFEMDLESMGQSTANVALELVMNLMRIETGPEKAMLRRAAVMLVLDVVKGLDKVYESKADQIQGKTRLADIVVTVGESLDSVVNELRTVRTSEDDEIVNHYIDAVLESVENWRTKALLGVSADGEIIRPYRDLELSEGRLAGLDIDPNKIEAARSRPGVVEVIEDD